MKRMFGILALMVIAGAMIAGCVQPGGNETAAPGTTTPGATGTPAATTATPVGTTPASTANATETPPAPPAAGGESVSITDRGFVPDVLTVSQGTTVTWPHHAAENETVTATGQAADFDSGVLQPGDSYNFTFATPDNYSYMSLPTGFTGLIVVTGNTTS